MIGRGSIEDAKAMQASFTRAKGSKPRPGNATRERITRAGHPPVPRPLTTWSSPGNAPVYNRSQNAPTPPMPAAPVSSGANTLRPVASSTLYANAYPDTNGYQQVKPRDPPAPSNAQSSGCRDVATVKPVERILPPQSVAAPQNRAMNQGQGNSSTQMHVSPPDSAASVQRPHGPQSFNQPLQGYLGQAVSNPTNGNGATTAPSSANYSHQPGLFDDDVSMADSDAPSGYKSLGSKGLEASRWYNDGADNEGHAFISEEPSGPPPERRTSRIPTGPMVINGLVKGYGLGDSRWAP
ncbi:hypothetical protein GGR53DRAFT_461914 [Hypoxylon sp. FL1150]|nr:hypothetical protein GGR53DRAFT_461914 [Hypoxylon sp. FL1150]